MAYLKDDIIVYKDSVRNLCVYTAEVQRFTEALDKGQRISRRCLTYALSKVKSYHRITRQVMNRMGIPGDIEFMEDNEFLGFSIKQGRLTLEDTRDVVFDTCLKWIEGFPDEANHYQYAVAMYCLALAYPDTLKLENFYPEYMLKGLKKTDGQGKAA